MTRLNMRELICDIRRDQTYTSIVLQQTVTNAGWTNPTFFSATRNYELKDV